ncbi:MAG TPA: BlaI/MecI/CopY family transcriptional regulator [Terriglobales bacterium]|jgi:BlaI family penicillinase repressor|nr:BlaI/MecI/CopY family transcriptional regulator [Terriglobales bacterium]
MTKNAQWQLGRRERQIMDIVFKLGRASVTQVQSELPDPPSYSAVRAMLGFLEDKGYLRHEQNGLKYVYTPTTDRQKARTSALEHLVRTFFGGSATEAAAALIELPNTGLAEKERLRLLSAIQKAKQEGR